MRTRTFAAVAALAAVGLAGCTSDDGTSTEPAPGEIDYDVAVTRTAVLYAIASEGLEFNPWTGTVMDRDSDGAQQEVSEELTTQGMETLCEWARSDEDGPMGELYLSAIAQEAAYGAVIASASEEFREAYGVLWLGQVYGAPEDDQAASVRADAMDQLDGELHDEWVELWEQMETLEDQVLTVEGAQSAQAAAAERCDVDDPAPVTEAAQLVNGRPMSQPWAQE